MPRITYNMVNTEPYKIFHLDWVPTSLFINNTTRYPVYVNIGSSSKPSSKQNSDIIAPFSSYSADPTGARDFAVFVDNSSDPNATFPYVVNIVFSSGGSSAQNTINLAQTGIVNSAYLAKVLTIQSAFLIDLWALDDLNVLTYDRINQNRNGIYFNNPSLSANLFADNQIRVPIFNGTNQYSNVFSSGLASIFSVANGTMLIWAQLAIALWANATSYTFFKVGASVGGAYEIYKSGAAPNNIQFRLPGGGGGFAITTSNNWMAFCITWNQSLNRTRFYKDGSLLSTPTWSTMATPIFANIGADGVPAQFMNGSLAVAALWTTELTGAEVLSISTAP